MYDKLSIHRFERKIKPRIFWSNTSSFSSHKPTHTRKECGGLKQRGSDLEAETYMNDWTCRSTDREWAGKEHHERYKVSLSLLCIEDT